MGDEKDDDYGRVMGEFVTMAEKMVAELRERFETVQKTAEKLAVMYGESKDTEFQELFGYFMEFREQLLEVQEVVKKSELEEIKRKKKAAAKMKKKKQMMRGKGAQTTTEKSPIGPTRPRTGARKKPPLPKGKPKGKPMVGQANVLAEMGDPAVHMKRLKKKKKKPSSRPPKAENPKAATANILAEMGDPAVYMKMLREKRKKKGTQRSEKRNRQSIYSKKDSRSKRNLRSKRIIEAN